VPLAFLFSVSATFLPVLLTMGLLYLTQNRTAEMLRATLIDAGLCLLAILAGLPWGAVGVAAALSIVGLTVRTPVAFWLATRRSPVSIADVWRAIAPPASAALAAAAAAWTARRFTSLDVSAEAAATVGAAAFLAVLLVLLAWPETRREMCSGAHRAAILVRRRRAVLDP
jgi:PST family polysaccharide transporter